MEDAHTAGCKIVLAAMEVDEFAGARTAQAERHRVDREIAASQIISKRSRSHSRQSARPRVRFCSRAREVQSHTDTFDYSRSEPSMADSSCVELSGKGLRHGDRVAFDDQIDVTHRNIEQEVSHCTAHKIEISVALFG
jgi:hypothetical protein